MGKKKRLKGEAWRHERARERVDAEVGPSLLGARDTAQADALGIRFGRSSAGGGDRLRLSWSVPGEDPYTLLLAVRRVRAIVDLLELDAVAALRAPGGVGDEAPWSWREIGEPLGVTGEAARQRLASRVVGYGRAAAYVGAR